MPPIVDIACVCKCIFFLQYLFNFNSFSFRIQTNDSFTELYEMQTRKEKDNTKQMSASKRKFFATFRRISRQQNWLWKNRMISRHIFAIHFIFSSVHRKRHANIFYVFPSPELHKLIKAKKDAPKMFSLGEFVGAHTRKYLGIYVVRENVWK